MGSTDRALPESPSARSLRVSSTASLGQWTRAQGQGYKGNLMQLHRSHTLHYQSYSPKSQARTTASPFATRSRSLVHHAVRSQYRRAYSQLLKPLDSSGQRTGVARGRMGLRCRTASKARRIVEDSAHPPQPRLKLVSFSAGESRHSTVLSR